MLDFVDDVVDQLGSRHRLAQVHKILEGGTGADRQLKVYEPHKIYPSVVSYVRDHF
jgi:carboxylate-amine ligase